MLYLFVLYRFGGAEFPPLIMFKIFIHSGGQGVKYYCGKKVIKPASEVIKMLTYKIIYHLTLYLHKEKNTNSSLYCDSGYVIHLEWSTL